MRIAELAPFRFFPCSSLLEVVSPATEDHILDCALLFRRFTDGHVVLLSDDISFKIKAMAEVSLIQFPNAFCPHGITDISEEYFDVYTSGSAL